jgi:hypothetical protein
MVVHILSCGIFQPEIEKILPEIKLELLNQNIEISFVPPALHVDNNKLKVGIVNELEHLKDQKTVLLYGSMCHPELHQIVSDYGVTYPNAPNCIELLLDPERKKEIDRTCNVFYMTSGWFKYWREIFQQGQGWDSIDARMNFGLYDKILVLDSGIAEISNEEILELFDYVQVPIDIEQISLDYFKNVITEMCRNINKD